MTTKLIALNVLLAAGIGATVWQLNVRWTAAAIQREKTLHVRVKPVTVAPVAPAPKPEAPTPAQYAQVAEKNLFSSDRNPTVVIEPVKVDPPKPMPPLPVVYGVMGLPSGARAIMAEKPGQQSRSIRTGDTIGEFKVLALDTQNVAFDWNGKEVKRRIDELVDRSNAPTQNNQGPAAPAAAAAAPAPPQPSGPATSKDVGIELTPGVHACRPGENSPAGTVIDGFRKTITYSPFGATCRWVK
ncbi:MAG: hypothetical protein JWN34_2099 [Bryobacterales bacterium]|nr:hypothetical protein [Bryobacterales bacterium]